MHEQICNMLVECLCHVMVLKIQQVTRHGVLPCEVLCWMHATYLLRLTKSASVSAV